jgi:predicted dehydrogenase
MDDSGANARRDFLKLAAGAAALTRSTQLIAQEPAPNGCAPVAASDRLGIALIGAGGQGNSDVRAALKVPGVQLVGVADIYDGRLQRAKEVYCKDLLTTRDHREILARKDVDAVLIATPDHWHAAIAIEALNAGKDVYCQKPMTQTVEDGQRLVEAQKKTGRIVQVGSQRVSSIVYAKARDLMKSGAIGDLFLVEAWWNRNSALGAWQYTIPADASPANIDWDRFLGRAPKRPFDPVRLFRWRNYSDYGTGVAGDLFVHLFSGLHAVTGSLGPNRVMTAGGLRYWKDGRDAPDVMLGLYNYPKTERHPEFNLSLKVNFADHAGGEEGFRFLGTDGVMTILRDGVTITRKPKDREPGYTIDTFPKAAQEAFLKEYRQKYPPTEDISKATEERYMAPRGYSEQDHHLKNFVEAVKGRKAVVEDAVFGLRAAGPALLSNISLFENRAVSWNPETMRIESGGTALPAVAPAAKRG